MIFSKNSKTSQVDASIVSFSLGRSVSRKGGYDILERPLIKADYVFRAIIRKERFQLSGNILSKHSRAFKFRLSRKNPKEKISKI